MIRYLSAITHHIRQNSYCRLRILALLQLFPCPIKKNFLIAKSVLAREKHMFAYPEFTYYQIHRKCLLSEQRCTFIFIYASLSLYWPLAEFLPIFYLQPKQLTKLIHASVAVFQNNYCLSEQTSILLLKLSWRSIDSSLNI